MIDPVNVWLTVDEAKWLESAARRAADDTIVEGAAEPLRALASKLAAAIKEARA